MLSLVSTTLKSKEIIILYEDSVYTSETTHRASIGRNKRRILPEGTHLVVIITRIHTHTHTHTHSMGGGNKKY